MKKVLFLENFIFVVKSTNALDNAIITEFVHINIKTSKKNGSKMGSKESILIHSKFKSRINAQKKFLLVKSNIIKENAFAEILILVMQDARIVEAYVNSKKIIHKSIKLNIGIKKSLCMPLKAKKNKYV